MENTASSLGPPACSKISHLLAQAQKVKVIHLKKGVKHFSVRLNKFFFIDLSKFPNISLSGLHSDGDRIIQ